MDRQARDVFGFEEEVGAEGGGAACHADGVAGLVQAGGELSGLVKLPVVGQVDLGDDAQDGASVDGDRAVEEAVAVAKRGADENDRQQVGAGFGQGGDGAFDGVKQCVLLA